MIIVYSIIFLCLFNQYPYSKADLLNNPEATIAQKMSEYKPEIKVKNIEILGQIGNKKERFIIFKYNGKLKNAFAVSSLFGLRYKLLISDLTNDEDSNGESIYNSNLPVNFLLHDYFYERDYTYFENEFTLVQSTFQIHNDIEPFIVTMFVAFLAELFRKYRKKVQSNNGKN